MFFTRKKNQPQPTIHTQTFQGREFSFGYDEFRDVYIIDHFMKRYELKAEAATDLENYCNDQREKYKKAKELYQRWGMVAIHTGAEFPSISEWYNQLSPEYKERYIAVFDLENANNEAIVTDDMKRMIRGDYERYLPSFGIMPNSEEEDIELSQRVGLLVIEENGTRYVSTKPHEAKSSIISNYQNQLRENPTRRPTMAIWYKAIGGKVNLLGVKAEKFREPQELSLEIDLNRYKH